MWGDDDIECGVGCLGCSYCKNYKNSLDPYPHLQSKPLYPSDPPPNWKALAQLLAACDSWAEETITTPLSIQDKILLEAIWEARRSGLINRKKL